MPDRKQRLYREATEIAARLLEQRLCDDPRAARSRALREIGLSPDSPKPSLSDIEEATRARLSLFRKGEQEQRLARMRRTALEAMQLLEQFRPRLVGEVLNGTAADHSAIRLQLFSDTPEEVAFHLIDHKIPWRQEHVTLKIARNRREQRPLFSFYAGNQRVELVILGSEEYRNPPLNPVDDKPERGATPQQLQQLLEQ